MALNPAENVFPPLEPLSGCLNQPELRDTCVGATIVVRTPLDPAVHFAVRLTLAEVLDIDVAAFDLAVERGWSAPPLRW